MPRAAAVVDVTSELDVSMSKAVLSCGCIALQQHTGSQCLLTRSEFSMCICKTKCVMCNFYNTKVFKTVELLNTKTDCEGQ